MDHGFDGASIDDIADRLSATKGRIYHYYRRKLDILIDIHLHYLDLNLTEARPLAAAGGTAADRMREMSESHVLRIMKHVAYARVGLFSTVQGSAGPHRSKLIDATSKFRSEYEALFVDTLRAGIGSGEFRKVDPRLTAKPLLGALNWTAVWFSPRTTPTSEYESIASDVAHYAIAGLLPS
jgi:AcrR family transcriptional regulator